LGGYLNKSINLTTPQRPTGDLVNYPPPSMRLLLYIDHERGIFTKTYELNPSIDIERTIEAELIDGTWVPKEFRAIYKNKLIEGTIIEEVIFSDIELNKSIQNIEFKP